MVSQIVRYDSWRKHMRAFRTLSSRMRLQTMYLELRTGAEGSSAADGAQDPAQDPDGAHRFFDFRYNIYMALWLEKRNDLTDCSFQYGEVSSA